jgi:hypothetical protein
MFFVFLTLTPQVVKHTKQKQIKHLMIKKQAIWVRVYKYYLLIYMYSRIYIAV